MFTREVTDLPKIAFDAEKRELELTFSSENPVERLSWELGYYDEILVHDKGSMNVGRVARRVCPFLENHDRDQRLGRVLEAWVDGDKGKAKVRLNRNPLADQLISEIEDDTCSGISVGYVPKKMKVVTKPLFDNEGNQTQKAVVHVTEWEVLEMSHVSIPADIGVGIRGAEEKHHLDGVIIEGFDIPKEQTRAMGNSNNTPPPSGGETPDVSALIRQIDQLTTQLAALQSEATQRAENERNLRAELDAMRIGTALAGSYASLRRAADGYLKDAKLTRAEYDELFPEKAEEGLSLEGTELRDIQTRLKNVEFYLNVCSKRSPQLPTNLPGSEGIRDLLPLDVSGDEENLDEWASDFFENRKLPSLY